MNSFTFGIPPPPPPRPKRLRDQIDDEDDLEQYSIPYAHRPAIGIPPTSHQDDEPQDEEEPEEEEVEEDVAALSDPMSSLTSQALNPDGTPKRPMNAFMIFARQRRPQVSAQHPSMRTGEISKILSKEWQSMSKLEKQFYLDNAKKLKDVFNTRWPDYVYKRRPNNSRKRRKNSTTSKPDDFPPALEHAPQHLDSSVGFMENSQHQPLQSPSYHRPMSSSGPPPSTTASSLSRNDFVLQPATPFATQDRGRLISPTGSTSNFQQNVGPSHMGKELSSTPPSDLNAYCSSAYPTYPYYPSQSHSPDRTIPSSSATYTERPGGAWAQRSIECETIHPPSTATSSSSTTSHELTYTSEPTAQTIWSRESSSTLAHEPSNIPHSQFDGGTRNGPDDWSALRLASGAHRYGSQLGSSSVGSPSHLSKDMHQASSNSSRPTYQLEANPPRQFQSSAPTSAAQHGSATSMNSASSNLNAGHYPFTLLTTPFYPPGGGPSTSITASGTISHGSSGIMNVNHSSGTFVDMAPNPLQPHDRSYCSGASHSVLSQRRSYSSSSHGTQEQLLPSHLDQSGSTTAASLPTTSSPPVSTPPTPSYSASPRSVQYPILSSSATFSRHLPHSEPRSHSQFDNKTSSQLHHAGGQGSINPPSNTSSTVQGNGRSRHPVMNPGLSPFEYPVSGGVRLGQPIDARHQHYWPGVKSEPGM